MHLFNMGKNLGKGKSLNMVYVKCPHCSEGGHTFPKKHKKYYCPKTWQEIKR